MVTIISLLSVQLFVLISVSTSVSVRSDETCVLHVRCIIQDLMLMLIYTANLQDGLDYLNHLETGCHERNEDSSNGNCSNLHFEEINFACGCCLGYD